MGLLSIFKVKSKIYPVTNLLELSKEMQLLLENYYNFSLLFNKDQNYRYSFEKIAKIHYEFIDKFSKLYNLIKLYDIQVNILNRNKFEKYNAIFLYNVNNLMKEIHLKPKRRFFQQRDVKYLLMELQNAYGAI